MFRKVSVIAIALVWGCFLSCHRTDGDRIGHKGSGVNDPERFARISFDTTFHDFGQVVQGEKVSCLMMYRNTGNTDLLINRAETSCGCTVPRWSKDPLKPGKTNSIEVIFDTSGRAGKQYKTVTIFSNARNSIVRLNFTAEIIIKQ